MTVTVTNPISASYTPNGATTSFGFDFKIGATDEIAVFRTLSGTVTVVDPDDYTVTIAVDGEGGTVVFNTAPVAGSGALHIASDPSFTQQADFGSEGPFSPASVNGLFDRDAIKAIYLKRYMESVEEAAADALQDEIDVRLLGDIGLQTQFDAFEALTKGDPGGNILAIGLFVGAGVLSIPIGTDVVRTAGYSLLGVGVADYLYDAAINAAYVTANPRTSFVSSNGRGFKLFSPFFTHSPEQVGARGDTVTDDSEALFTLAGVINALGGGVVELNPKATYMVGGQTYTAVPYLTIYNWPPNFMNLLKFTNCTNVTVRGNGARIKTLNNAKYGVFDAAGNPVATVPPYTGTGVGIPYWAMIEFRDCGRVHIENVELNGNLLNMVVGGRHAADSSGWQLAAYGLAFYGCTGPITGKNVYTHHHGLDGVLIDGPAQNVTSPSENGHMAAVRSVCNGRQGLSFVGGKGWSFDDCSFNWTGKANAGSDTLGPVATAPSAGVDIEAEGKIIRGLLFDNCDFVGNKGPGLIGDSGDSADITAENSLFIGTTWQALWPNKPGMKFVNCDIVGQVISVYDHADPALAAQFHICRFFGGLARSPTGAVYGGQLLSFGDSDLNVLLDTCQLDTEGNTGLVGAFGMGQARIKDCTYIQDGTGLSTFRGVFSGHNRIESAGTNDLTGSASYRNYGRLFLNGVEVEPTPLDSDLITASGKRFVAKSTGNRELALSYSGTSHGLIQSNIPGVEWQPLYIEGKPVRLRYGGTDVFTVGNLWVNVEPFVEFRVNGTKVLSTQQAAVANPAGGAVIDVEARAKLVEVITHLRTHGLIAT